VYCKSFDTVVMNQSMNNNDNTIISSSSSPQLKLSDRLYKLKNSFEYDVLRIFKLSSINNVTSSINNFDYVFVEMNSIDQMTEFPIMIENIIRSNRTILIITYFIDITNNNIHINIIEGKIESGTLHDMIYNNNSNGSDTTIKKTINESFFGPLIQSNYKEWKVMHTNIEGYGDIYHIDIVI